MGSWVDEQFSSSIQPETNVFDITKGPSKELNKPQNRKQTLEAELKLLDWHKLANDSAIKAALMQTKTLKETTPVKGDDYTHNAKWMKHIIDDENSKPLEVSRDFVLTFEKKEKENNERLTSQVERHINTLKTLRSKLEEQSEIQARQEEFREWKREFKAKKDAVLTGKTLATINAFAEKTQSETGTGCVRGLSRTNESSRYSASKDKSSTPQHYQSMQSRDLSTVLESLNKLADLESRITMLEKDNAYDQIQRTDNSKQAVADSRTTLEFKKKRTKGALKESVRTVYAVKEKPAPWFPNQKKKKVGSKTGGGGGTFLTANVNDEDEEDPVAISAEQARIERQRLIALAPAGQKELRSRILQKREKAKEIEAGAKRHEKALKELIERRADNVAKAKQGPVVRATKGASSGVKTKNRHLAQLEEIKSSHKKRKDQILRGGASSGTGDGYRGSATAPTGRGPPLAPVPEGPSAGRGGGNTQKRIPNTHTLGTVTRRTKSVPVRRAVTTYDSTSATGGGNSSNIMMPAIVGSGVTGIRALKGQKARGY